MLNPPTQWTYLLTVSLFLLLLSQAGQVFQHAQKRVLNLFLFVLLSTASAIHVLGYRPLLKKTFSARYLRPDDEARGLYSLALYNAITLGLLILVALITVGVEEAAEEAVKASKKKKKTEEPKTE